MKKFNIFILVGFIFLGVTFIIAGPIDIVNSDRDLTTNQSLKDALADKGIVNASSTHTIDWDRETAQTCLEHPTDPNFNLPCIKKVPTFFMNCTSFNITLDSETNETLTEVCIEFTKVNKTLDEIRVELQTKEDEVLEKLAIAFEQRATTSNPQTISEGIITIQ